MSSVYTAKRPVVLIVEDDFFIRSHAALMIEEAAFDVIEASNADEAIAILEARAVSGRFESVFGYGGFSNCCKSDSIFAISSGEDEYGKGLFDGLENSGCGLGRGRREPA